MLYAFCYSCADGNAYCKAVAIYYGGVDSGRLAQMGGALPAYYAFDDDLDFWCDKATLAAIAAGDLDAFVRRPTFLCVNVFALSLLENVMEDSKGTVKGPLCLLVLTVVVCS